MAGVISLGECMVELNLTGSGSALVGSAGDTFNTAVYLRRLGLPTAYGAALGKSDPFSLAILARMADEGIDTGLMVQAEGRMPGLYAIVRDAAGERSFYYWRGEAPARDYYQLVDLGKLEAALREATLIYLSAVSLAVIGERGRAVLLPLLARVAEAGVAVAFDTNYRAELWPGVEISGAAIRAAIGVSRYLSINTADMGAFGGGDAEAMARDWAADGVEVVLRHEDRRVEVMSGAAVERFGPARQVPVVDTTGAGDSFNAGYLAARLKGGDIAHAVAEARRLAAAVVQHPGAIIPRDAMPD